MNENPEQEQNNEAPAQRNMAVDSQNQALQGLAANAGSIILSLAEADAKAKDYAAKRMIDALNEGNVDVITENSVIGMDDPLVTANSIPKGAAIDPDVFVPDEAEFSTSFSIAIHDENNLTVGSDISTEASVNVGWGPVSAGVKVTADVSVNSEKKRSTDNTATVDLSVKMKQKPAPEIFNRILDSQLKVTDTINKLNQEIIMTRLSLQKRGIVEDLATDEGQQKMLAGSTPEGE